MVRLSDRLILGRCPHCEVPDPQLDRAWATETTSAGATRFWAVYRCTSCAGLVLAASAEGPTAEVTETYPLPSEPPPELPVSVQEALRNAIKHRETPFRSVALLAIAIMEMLHSAGYESGDILERLGAAASDQRLPQDLAGWAEDLRLDQLGSNPSISASDFERHLDFTVTLGDYLFVLPERIRRCRERLSNPTAEFPTEISPLRASWRDYSPRTGDYPGI